VADVNQLFADAVSRHQSGDVAVAEQMYRSVIAASPNHAAAYCNLGALLGKSGREDEAAQCYREALVAVPGYPDAHFNLGNLYRRQNKNRDAVEQYTNCLRGNPAHVSAGFNLGLAYINLGDLQSAKRCFLQVVKLEPSFADAWGRLGDLHLRCVESASAITAFQKYCELRPVDDRGQNNLALALANDGRHGDAIDLLQKLVRIRPEYAEAHNTLGVTLEAIGKKDEALLHYDAAVKAKPDYADAWSNRGMNLLESGRADEAIESLQQSVNLRPDVPAVHSNLLLAINYSSNYSPDQIASEHRRWAERFAGNPPPPFLPADTNPDRIVKIGYVSADFRQHTVAGFIDALLTNHDRRKFNITSYFNGSRPDDMTERLKTLSDSWQVISGYSDDQIAARIQSDRIDVLIDLSGHTAGNRMLVFARRPAPLQLTMFGYPNTTGISAIDYRVTDAVSDPATVTAGPSPERLLRLPKLAWVYNPPPKSPAIAALPSLTTKFFTFGCLNNAAKISDACLSAWSDVLNAVPNSRLVLLAGQSNAGAKRLADRFGSAGIPRDRVELVYRLPRDQYFTAYEGFDLALDPFPYNGGVTTCDALWMGVPVLTVEGHSYASRQGMAVLDALGLPGFVAKKPSDLAELAQSWSNRRPELAQIRAGLRNRMQMSAVCDLPGYVKAFETELLKVWKQKLSG
jgi:protein O-GlcNAc transferase